LLSEAMVATTMDFAVGVGKNAAPEEVSFQRVVDTFVVHHDAAGCSANAQMPIVTRLQRIALMRSRLGCIMTTSINLTRLSVTCLSLRGSALQRTTC